MVPIYIPINRECAKSLQLCLPLCNCMDSSLPGFPVHSIVQARTLQGVAMPFSRGSSQPKDQTHISCLLPWQAGSLPLAPSGQQCTSVLFSHILTNTCYIFLLENSLSNRYKLIYFKSFFFK